MSLVFGNHCQKFAQSFFSFPDKAFQHISDFKELKQPPEGKALDKAEKNEPRWEQPGEID